MPDVKKKNANPRFTVHFMKISALQQALGIPDVQT